MGEYVLWYFLAINVFTFLIWGIDKWKAIKKKWRIPEKKLFLYSGLGGWVGALLGMSFFRHKTIKGKFLVWFYVICFVWIAVLISILYLDLV